MDIKTRLLRLEKQLASKVDTRIRVQYKDGSQRIINGYESISCALQDRGEIESFEDVSANNDNVEIIGLLNAILLIKEVGETDELQI